MSIEIYTSHSKEDSKHFIFEKIAKNGWAGMIAPDQIARFDSFYEQLIDDLYFIIEYPYVDKVYRDSYYNYFAMKNYAYERDCIKVALFKKPIRPIDFTKPRKHHSLQNKFLGFFVIRPTSQIFGRTVISPKAYKRNNFHICESEFEVSVNSVKFSIQGFPSASQDGETMTCGETCIWSLLEHYGNKHDQYASVLPSQINSVINRFSADRRFPSDGVTISQISFAIKEFGFGTKIYARSYYTGKEFFNTISCYIESGIPVISIIENFKDKNKDAHALLCVGHEAATPTAYTSLEGKTFELHGANDEHQPTNKTIRLYDNDDVNKKFVFIDDNKYPYYTSFMADDTYKEDYKVTYAIVPLYQKIFLDAVAVKAFIERLFTKGEFKFIAKQEVFLRIYLTTNRSYKNYLKTNKSFTVREIKEYILSLTMAKYIWVAELCDKDLYTNEMKANGLLILDATEPDTRNYKPLIFGFYNHHVILNNGSKVKLPGHELCFDIFRDNLKFY